MSRGDTIAAVATPPGRGAVGIVRVSGPLSLKIARSITGINPIPRHTYFCDFLSVGNSVIDQGLAIFFKGPSSYTGEDVLELQGHGGPIVLDLVLRRVIELGCRIAQPGEFTERAFLNDKLDLAQAEAVSDLIEAGSEQAAKAAVMSLQGSFSEKINDLLKLLIDLRVYIESALDFAEEEIDFLAEDVLVKRIEALRAGFSSLKVTAGQGRLLQEGMRIVIAGKPNVGKSSLLNALSGHNRAIVTDIPGTTRDALSEQIHIDGVPLHIIDTAGLRDSEDPVEIEGIRRTHEQIRKADRVIIVSAADSEETSEPVWLDAEIPIDYVINKIDLQRHESARIESRDEHHRIYLSAKTGQGIALLINHLKTCMGFNTGAEGIFMARRRHLDALNQAEQHIGNALIHLQQNYAGELCAEELRYAQESLNKVTGEFSNDDLLGKIFSSFCIGK